MTSQPPDALTGTQFASRLARTLDIPEYAAREIVRGFSATLNDCLAQGQAVQIMGLGTFELHARPARAAWDVSRGQRIVQPARLAPRFRFARLAQQRLTRLERGQ